MAAKNRYYAIFSDGTKITRGSFNAYGAAWAVLYEGKVVSTGFSRDRITAERNAAAFSSQYVGRQDYNACVHPRGSRTPSWHAWANDVIRSWGGKKAWDEAIKKHEQAARIEIVDAIAE